MSVSLRLTAVRFGSDLISGFPVWITGRVVTPDTTLRVSDGRYQLLDPTNRYVGSFTVTGDQIGEAEFDTLANELKRAACMSSPQPPLTMAAMLDKRFSAAELLAESLSSPAALAAIGHTATTATTELLTELELLVLEGHSLILGAFYQHGSEETLRHHGFGSRHGLGVYIDRLNELMDVRLGLIQAAATPPPV